MTATRKVPRSLSVTRTQARVDARRALAAPDVIAEPGVMVTTISNMIEI